MPVLRITGLLTGGDPYGNRVPIVVRERESVSVHMAKGNR